VCTCVANMWVYVHMLLVFDKKCVSVIFVIKKVNVCDTYIYIYIYIYMYIFMYTEREREMRGQRKEEEKQKK
jgi:hypothetical protein